MIDLIEVDARSEAMPAVSWSAEQSLRGVLPPTWPLFSDARDVLFAPGTAQSPLFTALLCLFVSSERTSESDRCLECMAVSRSLNEGDGYEWDALIESALPFPVMTEPSSGPDPLLHLRNDDLERNHRFGSDHMLPESTQ